MNVNPGRLADAADLLGLGVKGSRDQVRGLARAKPLPDQLNLAGLKFFWTARDFWQRAG
jgi:hypothetical protein